MGPFIKLLNQVFPCFHYFNKSTPSHIVKYSIKFYFEEWKNEMLINCHLRQLTISGNKYKKKPNTKKGVFTYQKLTYKEFFNLYNLLGKGINYLKYYLQFLFPKWIKI